MPNPSRLRQRLKNLVEEIPSLAQIALDRSPLWRGLVHDARRKCGKPNCHCADGALHVSTVLADRTGEKQRNFSLAGRDLPLFTRLTEDYRKVRKARARLVKITAEMLRLFDQLEEIRRKEAKRRHGGKLPPPRGKGETS